MNTSIDRISRARSGEDRISISLGDDVDPPVGGLGLDEDFDGVLRGGFGALGSGGGGGCHGGFLPGP
jgi:hypothetical protein